MFLAPARRALPYHHAASQTEFWRKIFQGTIYRHMRKCELLEEVGWKVITTLECDLKKFLERMLNQGEEQLRGSF